MGDHEAVHTGRRRRIRPPFLPDHPDIGWLPYLWLVYLGFIAIDPVVGGASQREWLILGLVTAAFLPLYFLGFWARTGRAVLTISGLIALLAAVYVPFNLSAWGLFIYAGAGLGYGFRPRTALALLLGLVSVIAAEGLLLDLPAWAWVSGVVMTGLVGVANVHFAEVRRKNEHLKAAREEVERLAKSAERERIARDLHDLLGHTLTLVAVKSDLAARLAERDPDRSRAEILEVHAISRQALAEVRRAVRGYRGEPGAAGLADELESARRTLESVGVSVELEGSQLAAPLRTQSGDGQTPSELTPERDEALALALREAVTNVLRHSGAGRCRITLEHGTEGRLRLEVADDGRGGDDPEGAGLAGMRERIEALGGNLVRRGGQGTTLSVEMPLTAAPGEGSRRGGDPEPASRAPLPDPRPAAGQA